MKYGLLIWATLVLTGGLAWAQPRVDAQKPVLTIAFGSCNSVNRPQDMWDRILESNPDVWIWLGDNVYADTKDTAVMRKEYEKQRSHPEYQRFIAKIPVIGVWDDHDFGTNNCGTENPIKAAAQQLFLDFIGEPATSARRTQNGIYTHYVWGPPGKRIGVILLDTRYFRDKPGPDADMLGPEQWKWLENTLENMQAELIFMVTSTQFLSDRKISDRWEEYPQSKQRMDALLAKYSKKGIVFLSGDVHKAEMMKWVKPEWGSMIYEFTSSGLTHAAWHIGAKGNSFAVAKAIVQRNYGLITIDWNEPVSLKLEVKNHKNFTVFKRTVYLNALRSGNP